MKLNRSQLKSILKECIQELLVEGAFHQVIKETVGPQGPMLSESSSSPSPDLLLKQQQYRQRLNEIVNGGEGPVELQQPSAAPTEAMRALSEQASMLVSNGNPGIKNVFQKIFEDTAQNLAREESPEFQPRPGEATLSDIMPKGQDIGHWAKLAMSKK